MDARKWVRLAYVALLANAVYRNFSIACLFFLVFAFLVDNEAGISWADESSEAMIDK